MSVRSQYLPFAALLLLFVPGSRAAPTDPPTPPMPTALMDTLEWRLVGPFRGGRADTVAGIPGDARTWYFGACGGGVWKSDDGGRAWRNVSDGFFGGAIGAIAVAESDPNVIYAGTGEQTVRGNVSSGEGVWRSTDAGRTWTFLGLKESRHIGRIRVDPRDADLVYVAAMGHLSGPNQERGVYRSKDGGATWERILFANEHAGAVDLVLDPTNPRILYASTWRVLRTPYSLESGGEGSGLWQSSDGGDTWQELSRNDGLPQEGELGIIGVAVCRSRPDRVYAMVEHQDGGLFRSEDAGKTWQKVNSDRDLRQRAWYYTRVYADPADADVVYVLNVDFKRSKDGGRTFASIAVPHGDNHDLWIDPTAPQHMIEANDGGANVSLDGGTTWTDLDGQPTAQFYRVTTDGHFPYRILGAQQDNSTVRILSRSDRGAITQRDWEPTAGGESGHIAAHPADPDIVYGGSYGGYLTRVNHRTGEARSVDVWPDNPMGGGAIDAAYRFQWNFPIFFSPHDPARLYAAGNMLFQTLDEGQTWQAISPDLTRNAAERLASSGGPITKDNTSVEYYCTIFAACESPRAAGTLWCGSDDGLLHLSRDAGRSWTNVTPAELPEWTQINSIEPHPTLGGGLYVAGTRYKSDDLTPYLFRTLDYGATWTRIDAGIDREHFTRVVRADPVRAGLLYAGTERGVYVSFDDGAAWQSLQLNLPIVPITDLAVKDGDLVAATQGRSFWVLDNLDHLRQLQPELIDAPVHLFAPEPVYRMTGGGGRARGNRGTNPPAGAVLRFRLAAAPDPAVEVTLEVRDARGELARRFSSKSTDDATKLGVKQGMNRCEWDLTYAGAKKVDGMILWGGLIDGPRGVPGGYVARLAVGDAVREVPIEVRKDPRSTATLADIEQQFAFLIAARDKQSEAHEAILRIRELRGGVDGGLARAPGQAELAALGTAIKERSGEVEKALYQTQNQSEQDPLNFPIRLNDKLGSVAGGVASSGDYPPTAAQRAVFRELSDKIDMQLDALGAIERDQVTEFNRIAAELGVPHVTPAPAAPEG